MSDWMIESTLAVSVIMLIGLVVDVALRRQSAALRHWVLAVAVMCAWVTPPARLILPPWTSIRLWHPVYSTVRPQPARRENADRVTVTTDTAFVPVLPVGAPVAPLGRAGAFPVLWVAGTAIGVITLLIGLARLRRIASRAVILDRGRWYDIAEEVRVGYGLSTPIRLLQSDHPALLIAWGWRAPTVLLPRSAPTWSDDRIEAVLAHELAHIARGDWLWQMAAAALRSVYWFNPLVWIMSGRLRVESEHACDDAVLNSGIEGSAYATHLLVLARALHHSFHEMSLPASAMARRSHLEGRVRAMLNRDLNRRPISWGTRVATLAVFAGLTLCVAGVRAQSVYYTLSGTVSDPTGRVLPNTTLVLTSGGTGAKYEVHSDASGVFEFVGLPAGSYTLKASSPGFTTLTSPDIQVAGNVQQNLQLTVGSLQETITVRGSGPLPVLDTAALQRRDDARRRSAQRMQQALSQCATGGASASIGGNILPPLKLVDVKPIYPEQLRASGVSGTVTMDAVIGTDGLVRDVQNVSGPHPDLEAAATTAVREWEFSPTLLNCQAIDVNMRVTVNFAAQP